MTHDVSPLTINERLRRGEIVCVYGKLYALCRDCGTVIRVNKPIVGSLHFCAPEVNRTDRSKEGSE